MRCLIFAGGELIDSDWHKSQIQPGDYLIAADKGAEYILALGHLPNIVVGDLDSINETTKEYLIAQGVEFKISPREKDETDTELALLHGLDLKPREILLFAGLGDRLDHLLANVFLLAGYLKRGIPIYFATPTQTLWMTDKSVVAKGYPGQVISLMAVSHEVINLTLTGFHYPLERATLPFGSSMGISNVMLTKEAKIEFSHGLLLVIKYHGAQS